MITQAAHSNGFTSQRTRSAAVRGVRRDDLLAKNYGLVHHVARNLAQRLSTEADLDDLVGAGAIGLVQAADSFDARRGLAFSTYAVPRIRGAMLDELRRQDHVPRSVRRRTRDVQRARDVLAGHLRREPTEHELSRLLGVPSDELRRWELDSAGATPSSLDQPLRADSAGATLSDAVTDERTVSPEDTLTHVQEVQCLMAAIAVLKPQERQVLALNFFEELRLQEIATVMRLSVCRISQIRTAALAKLRVSLSGLRVS